MRQPIALFVLLMQPISPVHLAVAQDPALEMWNVQIELQVVALPVSLAVPLIKDLLEEKKVANAESRLEALLVSGKATLTDWSIVRTNGSNGSDNVSTKSIIEFRYPTRFQAPTIGYYLSQGFSAVEPKRPPNHPMTFEAIPAEIETEEVGMELNGRVQITADGKMIELGYNPKFVRISGYAKWEGAGHTAIKVPQFEKTGTTTTLRVRNSQRTLAGVHKISNPPNFVELEIVKVVATKVE